MTPRIHSSAHVDPAAEIGEGTVLGPGVVVEGPVRIGPDCEIGAHAVLQGRVVMGAGNRVGPGAVIGADPQHLTFRRDTPSGVRIGDGNTLREHTTIHRAATENADTMVGDGNFLMAGAHLAHDVILGNRNVVANNALLGGHVRVGDGCFLGGGSVYHQFIRIGRLAVTQGISGFGMDIPPFCMGVGVNRIAGLNTVGLRRAGLGPDARRDLQDAYRLLFRSGLNRAQALEAAAAKSWSPEAEEFFQFARECGKRGLCAHLRSGQGRGESE